MSIGAIAAVALGVAMTLAGAAKVAAGPQWPAQAAALGAPGIAVPVLPWFEIVLGGLLCAQVARPVVGVLTIALLIAFTALIVLRLAQGRRPPCACFGSWSATPLGWRHLVRNAALIVVAIVAVVA